MDAEALRGRELENCTLQHVVGTGTLGAVYLAHQSQPSRQMAVKVFLRMTALELQQRQEFLTVFGREMPSVASLAHPSIVHIEDYGDVDGLAYITMPYVAGETLEDLLTRRGALPLSMVASYLEQIAAALDYAHARGIIHRDLKPSNILITPEQKVLVTDFHLTKLLEEGSTAQMRLSKTGLLDYMAPELVVGSKEVDGRADLYALGAILYRMVTGTPPFQGQTLMKVATKHLKVPPPSPCVARPDLPAAAEQVIYKALAKKRDERFDNARDLALLFRQAINGPGAPLLVSRGNAPLPLQETASNVNSADNAASGPLVAPRMLFGPKWRTSAMTAVSTGQVNNATDAMNLKAEDRVSKATLTSVAATGAYAALNEKTHQATTGQDLEASAGVVNFNPTTPFNPTLPLPEPGTTGNVTRALITGEIKQEDTSVTGTYKLTGPARIVTIPVSGQPGQYITGILPTTPFLPADQQAQAPASRSLQQRLKLPVFLLAALLVVFGSLTFLYIHNTASNHSRPSPNSTTASGTPNVAATATARAQAALNANTILYDPLSQNIRSWTVTSSGSILYQFKDQAYHITNNDAARVAPALLAGENLNQAFAYTLTMEEIHGDTTSVNNEFGMILRFSSLQKNGKQVVNFYTFEVLNKKGGEYQFWKYDNSQGATVSPWKELAHHAFGAEYHEGLGSANINTFKLLENGKNFTLTVNGKQAWTAQDGSFASGQVGMLVNLKGTEVAFSDLRLTYN